MKADLDCLPKNGKALTAKGVKPICPFQQVFQSTYLFGAFSPITGDHFLLELPTCNADTFQLFLNEFGKTAPDELKIMVLDNGAFHKAKKMNIPSNIALLFLPPYSPELNPAENKWAAYKRTFTNRLHKSLEELSQFIKEIVQNTKNQPLFLHARLTTFLKVSFGLFSISIWYKAKISWFDISRKNNIL